MARSDDLAPDDPIFTCQETLEAEEKINLDYLQAIRKIRQDKSRVAASRLAVEETANVPEAGTTNVTAEVPSNKKSTAKTMTCYIPGFGMTFKVASFRGHLNSTRHSDMQHVHIKELSSAYFGGTQIK